MLIDATKTDAAEVVAIRIEIAIAKLYKQDSQLCHILTHSVSVTEKPKNAKDRRGHAIARVLYTWLRRETDDQEAMAKDIETLYPLGRTDRWAAAVRTWALIARTEPNMFYQYATYANYAAD